MTIEIVPYDDRYRQGVAVLLKRLWSKDTTINDRYLRWRYHTNPVVTKPILHVAVDGGTVVAMRGARGVAWDIGVGRDAERFVVPCVGDTVIADSHGNQGLLNDLTMSLLEDMALREMHYTFNLSASRVTLLSSLHSGWRSIGTWPQVVRPGQTDDSAGEHTMFNHLDRFLGNRDPGNDAILVSDRPRPEAIMRITAAHPNRGRIRPFIDADYLEWRFRSPLHEYRFLYHERGEVDGYLVLQIAKRRPHRVYVLDIQAKEPATLAALIRSAVALGQFNELRLWWLRLPLEAMRVLKDLNFGRVPESQGLRRYLPTFLVRPTSVDTERSTWSINGVPLLDVGNWDIKMLIADTS